MTQLLMKSCGAVALLISIQACTLRTKQAPDAMVVNRIIEKISTISALPAITTAEGEVVESVQIQPLPYFEDRLSVGDIVIRPLPSLEEDNEPVGNPDEEIYAVPPVLEKLFSVDDAIHNYEGLTEREREILNERWKKGLVESQTYEFPVGITRLEFAGISRDSEIEEADATAWRLIESKQDLQLGIKSGLDSLMDFEEAMAGFLAEIEENNSTELMTDSRGRVSAGNFRRLRNQLAGDLTKVRDQVASGSLAYVIGRVGFASQILVEFDPGLDEEISDEDIAHLGRAGRAIFSSYDLTETREGNGTALTRDPKIYWGFVAYQLVIDAEGRLAIDTLQPLQLDENMQ